MRYSSATYLDLIVTFRQLWQQKEKELLLQKERYMAGLSKLQFAASQVTVMQDELRRLQPQLVDTSAETESLMVKIEQDTIEVEAQKEVIAADEALANEAAAAAQAIKDECESDLTEATPALEAAIQALDTLKPADITLVKSMRHPPSIVKLVLARLFFVSHLILILHRHHLPYCVFIATVDTGDGVGVRHETDQSGQETRPRRHRQNDGRLLAGRSKTTGTASFHS